MKNIVHKAIAVFFGACLWFVVSQQRYDTLTLQVPLCFYPCNSGSTIQSPENITVTLSGTRSALKQLEHQQLAAHIDISTLDPKKTWITIEARHLFLPATIKMVNFKPSPLPVHINIENKNSLPQGV